MSWSEYHQKAHSHQFLDKLEYFRHYLALTTKKLKTDLWLIYFEIKRPVCATFYYLKVFI